jgi:chaperonin GroES
VLKAHIAIETDPATAGFEITRETGGNMSKINIRPLYDRIVVKRKETTEQVRGGIIIPDTAKEKPQEAEVIAVGEGKYSDEGKRMKLDVKAGDTVLIGKYSGTEIKLDNVEYTILREDEVLAIVE